MRTARLAPCLLLALTASCAEPPAPDRTLPATPDADEPGTRIELARVWNLVGNAATPGHESVSLEGDAPGDTVLVWLDGAFEDEVEVAGGAFAFELDLTTLDAGEHELLLSSPRADTAFARRELVLTHPLYVITSVDWDQSDTADDELAWHESLHDAHPELRLTQFVGPYTWTNPTVSTERAAELTDWLASMSATYGDEVGLHIHPRCHFVEYAGVTCRSEPSYVYENGDATGYTVLSSAYTEAEYGQLVEAADELFVLAGLDKPVTFRAGGWIASSSVLSALAAHGYTADTSANNWQRMEEWQDRENNVLWEWNRDHWAPINDTSQPYVPSLADPALPGEPAIDLLEVPDNGILADYAEAAEMIDVFEANWGGGALLAPTVLSIGYHNRTAGPGYSYRERIEGALDHFDGFLLSEDAGPVLYETLDQMPAAFGR